MSDEPHIADAEDAFFVLAVTPDICKVGKAIVAFKPFQILSPEKSAFSTTVYARNEKVLLLDSFIKGVKGNAGKGIKSGVSLKSGNVEITQGSQTVIIEDRLTSRHDDQVQLNVRVN
jgi:hypothetical protein